MEWRGVLMWSEHRSFLNRPIFRLLFEHPRSTGRTIFSKGLFAMPRSFIDKNTRNNLSGCKIFLAVYATAPSAASPSLKEFWG